MGKADASFRPGETVRKLSHVDQLLNIPLGQINRGDFPAAGARNIYDLAVRPNQDFLRQIGDINAARHLHGAQIHDCDLIR